MYRFESFAASGLLDHDIYLVTIFHLELVWCIIVLESFSIENESALVATEPLSRAIRVHQLFELCRALNLEEYLSSILRLHLDVDVLGVLGCSSGGGC